MGHTVVELPVSSKVIVDTAKQCVVEYGGEVVKAHKARDSVYVVSRYKGEQAVGLVANGYVAENDGSVVIMDVFKAEKSGGCLYFKEMSEYMHPYFYDVPVAMLKLLSDTTNVSALAWRKQVQNIHSNKPYDGCKIVFKEPLNFKSLGPQTVFYVSKEILFGRKKATLNFRTEGGTLVNINHALKFHEYSIEDKA